MRVSRIFSGICPPFLEGGRMFSPGRPVGGRLAALVSDLSLLCKSGAELSAFAELRALDPLCSHLLSRLCSDWNAIGRSSNVSAPGRTARSASPRLSRPFDARSYLDTRVREHQGLC